MMKQMYKISLSLLAMFFLLNHSQAQNDESAYDFSWINPTGAYWKIEVKDDGMHRIYFETLEAMGFPTGARVQARRYQIFYRGQEIPIRVEAGDDEFLNQPEEFIEFYGQKYDGYLDSLLYENPRDMYNPYDPLYNGSQFYYLTYTPTFAQEGKRIAEFYQENDTLPREPWHWAEDRTMFADRYTPGAVFPKSLIAADLAGAQLSTFQNGEGFGTIFFQPRGIHPFAINIRGAVRDSVAVPFVQAAAAGRVNLARRISFHVGPDQDNLTLIDTFFIDDFSKAHFESYLYDSIARFPYVENGRLWIGVEVENINRVGSVYTLSYFNVEYPQRYSMFDKQRKLFRTRKNPEIGRSYIEIENIPPFARILDITNPANMRLIRGDSVNRRLRAVIPNTENQRKLFVYGDGDFVNVTEMKQTNIQLIRAPQVYNYLIVSHKSLREPSSEHSDPVQAFAEYRRSAKGGNYTPLVMEIETIYDLFSHGTIHPMGVRRFLDYMLEQGNPRFLFFVGRGFSLTTRAARVSDRLNIMPFGFPSSDTEYSAGLRGAPAVVPALATGRLSVSTPEQVSNYLNKVIEHESAASNAPWRKRVLHLSGGKSANEHRLFRQYMDGFANVARGNFLGGTVNTIAKQTTDFVEFIDISAEVNEGLHLITFFGHASANYNDIEIGNVTDPRLNFNNKGKYPLMIVNGCGSGDAFIGGSLGENWMAAKDKGAIAFIAHVHVGFTGQLRLYTQTFYETAFADINYFNQPIGIIHQEVIRRFLRRTGNDPLGVAGAQQIILQGDPALRYNAANKPDYFIDNSRLAIVPMRSQADQLRAVADSFRIRVDISNLGIADRERRPIPIRVKRTFSDGTSVWYPEITTPAINNRDTAYFTIRTSLENRSRANGLNRFEVYLDFNETIEEISEDNNSGVIEFLFRPQALLNIAPKEYSIASEQPVRMIAQNTNPLDGVRRYEFQLDTTDQFNSGVLKTTEFDDYITPEWLADLPVLRDSTVYYWRVRFADEQDAERQEEWYKSSFVYIPESPQGWSQSHFPQFKKADLVSMERDDTLRRWDFKKVIQNFEIIAKGSSHPDAKASEVILNGTPIVDGNCRVRRWIGLAINHRTGELYNPLPTESCGASLVAASIPEPFRGRNYIADFFNGIADNDWIILVNSGPLPPQNPRPFLEQMGISTEEFDAQNYGGSAPTIAIGRKNAALGSGTLLREPGATSQVNHNFTIEGRGDEGYIISSRIGPAREWGNVFREIVNSEEPQGDYWKLDLLGIDFNGNESLLQEVTSDAFDISNIDASRYPYLKLRGFFADSINISSPQLNRWQVIYQEVPEGILLFDTLSYRRNTTLEVIEGDSVRIGMKFRNISGSDFREPLLVRYTILNYETNNSIGYWDTLPPLPAGETVEFKATFESLPYRGENKLTTYVNPQIQPEQIYENNILEALFNVKEDDVNPVLDVAVDGVHIMDGDIVSPMPVISIGLRDDNKFLIREDTLGINLFLSTCDSCDFQRLNYTSGEVRWFVSQENNFRLEYRPERLEDGTYTLMVEAEDVRGNKSGIEPYKVRFDVINESSITHFYPYPNPFSTSMRFVFTLTGAEIPDDIRIQIMTITGKVVRTINRDELGTVRIGNNISEFAWDGTDEFGDPLANGVYLYKVDVRSRQTEIERRETARDDLFKRNLGKIYLMR
ncbi:MAG: hypothetical protein JJT94_05195 [Bernardetiaceae bacterium]|nr:hypothetical protein [Bernardetiaceae bacterium]